MREFCILQRSIAGNQEVLLPNRFSEVNHDKDHIHFLISIPPTMSVGSVVRIIKSNTARNLKQKFPFQASILGNREYLVSKLFCFHYWYQ